MHIIKRLKILLTIFLLLTAYTGNSQIITDTIQAVSALEEVVVSGAKFNEKSSKLAVSIRTIKQSDLKNLNTSTMANLLESAGAAFMQRSQQGGGSPVLRGFEASRVLLMVDGVRMNNAIYRAGHLQNIITIDPNILDRIEILYGPSSTLYGSDALGGVVNMFTRQPVLALPGKADTNTLNAAVRYSSAIQEMTGHVDFGVGGRKWASLTSFTYSDFGNASSGKNHDDKYPDFGLVKVFARTANGSDTAIKNNKPWKQIGTAYKQFDALQKVLFKPNDQTSHLLNLQVSQSSDIPRFDRLSEVAAGLPRFAEWYYGPQKRYAASYTYERKNIEGFFDELRAVASYQFVEESRYDRRFKQATRNERIEKIHVGNVTIDARKRMGTHELVVGIDGQSNNLTSKARGYNVTNGSITKITTRYPDGDNAMYYAAVYAQHLWKITENLTLNDGLRLNYVDLNSQFYDTTVIKFPFKEARQKQEAVSGNVGLSYTPGRQFKVAAVLSTGFRAPNFDDLAKVFDTRAGAVVVPNPDLKPEYTYNAEINLIKYFKINDNQYGARIGGSIYYTWFKNAIVTDRFTLNGQDSILYSGVKSVVLASQNKAEAHVWGFNAYGDISILPSLKLSGSITYTYGRFKNNNIEIPLDHVPPVFGRTGLKYECKRIDVEAYVQYNGWKRIKDYNPNGEDNAQYATADGMPAWYTINARCNYLINKNIQMQVAVENIADQHYRTFASGFSSPGRNFIVAIKAML